MEMMLLIRQYAVGKPFDDPEWQNQLSVCLQYACSSTARYQGVTEVGPARDADLRRIGDAGAAAVPRLVRTAQEG
jgi:hypothetical protein